MTTANPLLITQKLPISREKWELAKLYIEEIASISNPRYSAKNETSAIELPTLKDVVFTAQSLMKNAAAKAAVKIYNEYFNPGRDESEICYPCVRRAVEFLRRIMISKEAPIVFDTEDTIKMFVLYDHPTDIPGFYVIRCFYSKKGQNGLLPMPVPYLISSQLQECDNKMRIMGLFPINRDKNDDYKIIKTYV